MKRAILLLVFTLVACAQAKTQTPVISKLVLHTTFNAGIIDFVDGAVLQPNTTYYVEAIPQPGTRVGRVDFVLDSNLATTDRTSPFTSNPGIVATGDHTFTATPYRPRAGHKWIRGTPVVVSFTVVSPTASPTATPTPPLATPTPTPTATPTPSPTATASPSPTPSATPTATPVPPTPTPQPTATPSPSPSPTPSTTATPTPTPPTPTPTPILTATPSPSPSPTASPTPTPTPTPQTPTPTATATPSPSVTSSPSPTPTPTPVPTPAITLVVGKQVDNGSGMMVFQSRPLLDGDTFDRASNESVAAQVTAGSVLSVKWDFDGSLDNVDEDEPFTIAGDSSGDIYNAWFPPVGDHVVAATAYMGLSATGIAGNPVVVHLHVVDSTPPSPTPTPTPAPTPQVLNMTRDGGKPFVDGSILAANISHLITVNADASTTKVIMKWDNQVVKTDTAKPFDFARTPTAAGVHTFDATPSNAAGVSGVMFHVSFKVSAPSPTITPTPTPPPPTPTPPPPTPTPTPPPPTPTPKPTLTPTPTAKPSQTPSPTATPPPTPTPTPWSPTPSASPLPSGTPRTSGKYHLGWNGQADTLWYGAKSEAIVGPSPSPSGVAYPLSHPQPIVGQSGYFEPPVAVETYFIVVQGKGGVSNLITVPPTPSPTP